MAPVVADALLPSTGAFGSSRGELSEVRRRKAVPKTWHEVFAYLVPLVWVFQSTCPLLALRNAMS